MFNKLVLLLKKKNNFYSVDEELYNSIEEDEIDDFYVDTDDPFYL